MIQDMARVFHSMQENFMEEKFATTLAPRFGAWVRIIAEMDPGSSAFQVMMTAQRATTDMAEFSEIST
jgi:hypothetical protein